MMTTYQKLTVWLFSSFFRTSWLQDTWNWRCDSSRHFSLHPDDGIPVADDETVRVILHYIRMMAYLSQMTRQFSQSFTTSRWRHTCRRWRDSFRHPSLNPDDGIPVADDETILVILHYILMTAYLSQMTRQFLSSFTTPWWRHTCRRWQGNSGHPLLHPDDGIPVADDGRQFLSFFTTSWLWHTCRRWRDEIHPDDVIPFADDETILVILY